MSFDPKVYRNSKDGIGSPGDDKATDTTSAWTIVALLKSIADKFGVGGSFSPSTDVAQNSTTAGQTGGLTQAAVTTAAPAYTTAKTNPLSLKTNGDLRVADTDLAALTGALTETAPATDTASSGLNGRLQRIAQRITSLIAQVPATLGVKARTASLSVAMATEDAALFPASLGAKAAASSFAVTSSTEDAAQLGSLTETAPATDTASSGLNGRLQRIAQRLTSLIAVFPAALGGTTSAASFPVVLSSDGPFAIQTGSITETAPATDTASSGLNGRLQRIAQRITSLIALVPTSLGAKTAAASLAVTLATDDVLVAPIGIVTETAPATDTASSGLNGRLQRIAQRITSLIALVPTSLGAKTAANSFAVTLATDDPAVAALGTTAGAKVITDANGTVQQYLRGLVSQWIAGTLVVGAGSNLIGRSVADASAATGGIPSTARLLSAAGTSGDATNVKASAGRVYAIQGANVRSSAVYLKLYNSASAPTAGSGTPVKTLYLPPSGAFAFDWVLGLTFSSGIGFTLVTGSADNSSSSVTAGDVLALNIDYA